MERGGGGGVGEVEITGQPNQVIKQPLKRNAACLSCRKRKLKVSEKQGRGSIA